MHRLMTKQDREMARAAMVAGKIKVQPKGLDCAFYLYESAGKPCAMCFSGTAGRPMWRHSFRSEANRDGYIKRTIDGFKSTAAYKAKQKAEASQPCKLEVGHILVTCWGYDQTNREFFKVIAKKGSHTIVVQELEQLREYNEGMTGTALPGEAFLKGSRPYTCRVRHGSSAKIEGHYASLWSGQPVNWTAYA